MTAQMPAITVRLPWAAAQRSGAKLVENRGKRIPAQYIGQQIGIHASAEYDRPATWDTRILSWWWGPDRFDPVDATNFTLLFRKVIAVGTLVGCHQAVTVQAHACCAPWGQTFYNGKPAWHYVFTDMVALPEPVLAKGSLLLPWMMPDDVTAQVRRQLPQPAEDVNHAPV